MVTIDLLNESILNMPSFSRHLHNLMRAIQPWPWAVTKRPTSDTVTRASCWFSPILGKEQEKQYKVVLWTLEIASTHNIDKVSLLNHPLMSFSHWDMDTSTWPLVNTGCTFSAQTTSFCTDGHNERHQTHVDTTFVTLVGWGSNSFVILDTAEYVLCLSSCTTFHLGIWMICHI